MRTNNLFTKVASIVAIVATGISFSCQEEEVAVSPETAYVIEESSTDFYYEDADDMSGVAVSSDDRTSTGRLSSVTSDIADDRLLCATITLTLDAASTTEHPKGTIKIDFGAGCTDLRGNVRKGIIKIAFDGKRFIEGSTVTITFESYSINGVKLEGTRTLTNLTGSAEGSPVFKIELVGGKAIWLDGTFATREHCFERTWDRNETPLVFSDDQLTVSQCADATVAASGKNRRGINYQMIIVEDLVYKRCSPIAVDGTKKFKNTDTGQEITIDYGSGECDKTITITVNGVSRTIEGKGK
jgi:hypothetical protein